MSATRLGLLTGLALGFAGAFGGFVAFLIVGVFGALGLLVGRYLDGGIDVGAVADRFNGAAAGSRRSGR
jgi:hypothetical protein